MINYIKGDATLPQGEGKKIIMHICNDIGAWGAGFVLALSARYSAPEMMYRLWHREGYPITDENGKSVYPFELGHIQLVPAAEDIYVANMIAQRGLGRAKDGTPPIRYDALRECLKKVKDLALTIDATVHGPRLGCGLAGSSWDLIEPIILEELDGIDVTIYDFK
jgi:O-acetyl-ADP-ribose deacetylase (regulator of RNase III)